MISPPPGTAFKSNIYLTNSVCPKGECVHESPLPHMMEAEVVKGLNLSSQCWTCPLGQCDTGKAHKAELRSLAQNRSFVSDALFSHLD